MELQEFFQQNSRVALAFSGGVDSAYLLYAARRAGAKVKAYFIKTAFQPAFELADARKTAEMRGAELFKEKSTYSAPPKIGNTRMRETQVSLYAPLSFLAMI